MARIEARPVPGSGPLRVAAVQMTSGVRIEDNLASAHHLIAEAARAGARLICLPENFALMPRDEAERRAATEPGDGGPLQAFLAQEARAHGVWLAGGTLPIQGTAERPRSALLLLSPDGTQVARYDKIHLFDADLRSGGYRESDRFEPGNEVVVCAGPECTLGLAVCYDLRFPEQFRAMAARGAGIVIVPAAFTEETGRAHWELLVRARAVDTLSFVVAPAQTGQHENGRRTWGHSLVVGPWGEILGQQPEGPGCAVVDIDYGSLPAVRQRLPALNFGSPHADSDI
ncbi:MAG TPA: carbon-nitrogen hydrolase family protein [Acidiferrobacteraceae bacterium]|nr:carbon-nitrogen hydrolase family protein [Acidiferrobacteraceae bacterium]